MGDTRPICLYFCIVYKQLKVNKYEKVVDDWIRTRDLWTFVISATQPLPKYKDTKYLTQVSERHFNAFVPC